MSGNDEMASVVDDEESMIKYFREKIIGRPAVFSRAGDLPIDDTMPPIKKTNSQNSLTDIISTSTTSNEPTNQMEKLTTARRPISSSSPIIIPRKPPRSNASSQSSSSYTSVADQFESDDVSNSTFPSLSPTCQQLEHSAARDRISVKNKRRQPLKQKLSTLRETDDNEIDLFSSKTEDDEIPPPLPPKQRHLLKSSVSLPRSPSTTIATKPTTRTKKKKTEKILPISSTPEDEHPIHATTRAEPKAQQQPLIDLSDLDTARARLRISVRPRDRSADNILLATHTNAEVPENPPPIIPKFPSPMQRSMSFKRPQEMNKGESFNRPILKSNNEDNPSIVPKPNENEIISNDLSSPNDNINNSTQSMSRSSSQEHIYDNLDVFKRSKPNVNSSSNDDEPSTTSVVKAREHSLPKTRLRPVTMHIPTNNDKQTTNEFENVFNQLKKRGSVRRTRPSEESPPSPSPPVEEPPVVPQPENEPIITKPLEPTPTPPTPNRRKTVGGVHLPANNKVASDEAKPTPSWIDIAKQKQNKFQSISNEKNHPDECEQPISTEPSVAVRKQVPTADIRSNRKSMFEQSTAQNNAHVIERDSIRALKAGNPNRINNLIQFFDK